MYSISRRDVTRYNYVLRLARAHNSYGRFHMVAIACKGKKVISVGKNYYPTRKSGESVHVSYKGIGLHAEVQAIHDSVEAPGSTLYVAGCNANRTPLVSRPCPRCNNLLMYSGFKYIVYWNGTELVKEAVADLTKLAIPVYKERELLKQMKEAI